MKVHIGVDKDTKLVHSLVTTPANIHDSRTVSGLLHGNEEAVWGDSAYMGKTEEINGKAPNAVDNTHKRATKNRKLTEEEKIRNKMLSRTRVRVEHVFGVAKNIFGFVKVRYKGLAKNTSFVYVLFALSNLYMARKHLLQQPSWAKCLLISPKIRKGGRTWSKRTQGTGNRTKNTAFEPKLPA